MKEFFNPYRIMYGFGIIALCVALIMNITTAIPFVSFIPRVKWLEIAVNGFCLILCFVLFIFPHYKKLSYILFFLEGGMTTHIGFIGIVGPHIARMLVGEDQRYFLPLSAVCGMAILSMASIGSKMLIPGAMFPIGIVTAIIGVPFFFSLVLTRKRSYFK